MMIEAINNTQTNANYNKSADQGGGIESQSSPQRNNREPDQVELPIGNDQTENHLADSMTSIMNVNGPNQPVEEDKA